MPGVQAQAFFCAAANETADATQQIPAGRTIYAITVHNPHTAPNFLQIFDITNPTVGTTVPRYVVPLVDADDATVDGVTHVSFPGGLRIVTNPNDTDAGISFAVTATATGNGSPTAAAVVSIAYG